VLASLVVAGCDDSYPSDLAYPSRIDLLVLEAPDTQTLHPDPPGTLDQSIAKIGTGELKGKTADPKNLKAADRSKLQQILEKAFGTPAKPTIKSDDEEMQAGVKELLLQDERLEKGSKLYRRHCLQCHGLTGDGRGPTGPWVHPHPRDYRQGLFKFISSKGDANRKPQRADLLRTLRVGVEGTSMPSFALLEQEELEALVSYVIHLSLRGQVEYQVMRGLLNKDDPLDDIDGASKDYLSTYLQYWVNSDKENIKPQAYPKESNDPKANDESIRLGYKLFTEKGSSASCIDCHTDFGRQAPFRFDQWGTPVRPANLTTGVYRGGRRPIDIYWRIKGGIGPSGMAASSANLKDEEIWDIVHFVRALPYPAMLPEEIRDRIYVQEKAASGGHVEH
jgi:mono/diheme cytochrome c family protein